VSWGKWKESVIFVKMYHLSISKAIIRWQVKKAKNGKKFFT